MVVGVSMTHELQMMLRAAVDEFGRIDILVNNAGILGKRQSFSQSTQDDWDPVLKTNLIGVFKCTLEALKHMIRAKAGKIVNSASRAALEGDPLEPIYATTKAGMISFTKSLASELAEHNIDVNSTAPGLMKTRISQDISDDQREAYIRTIA